MAEPKAYEKYPVVNVLVYNLVTLVNYVIGVYILYRVGLVWGLLYAVYLVILEFYLYKEGCASCYYYGKRCVAGKGKIAPLFFRKDDPKKFCERKVTWKNLLPNMMITIFPLIGGGYLMWTGFEWLIAGLMAIPILIWVLGNPLVYGKLACPHCKQGRICCPANDFFGKKVEKKSQK